MSSITPKTSWITTTPGHGPSPTGGRAMKAGTPANSVSGIRTDQDFQRSGGHEVLECVAGALESKRAGDERLGLDLTARDQVDRALPVPDRAEHADEVDVADDQAVEVEGDRRRAREPEGDDGAARPDGVERRAHRAQPARAEDDDVDAVGGRGRRGDGIGVLGRVVL